MKIPVKDYFQLLSKYLKPQIRRVFLFAFIELLAIGCVLANPQILRYFIDTAKAGGTLEQLIIAALIYICIAQVQQGIIIVGGYLNESIGWKATNDLRADLARHCLELDMSFHNTHTPGEMIERIDGDVNALGNYFSQLLILLVMNGLVVAGILILLYFEDWRVGTGLLAFSITAILILARFRNIAVPHWKKTREASADLFGFLEERFTGTEDLRSCRAKPYVLRRFFEICSSWFQTERKASLITNVLFSTNSILFAAATAMSLGIGGYLYSQGLISIGTIYLIYHYANMLNDPIRRITRQIESAQQIGGSISRLYELSKIQTKIKNIPDMILPQGALSVEFNKVSFRYSKEAVLSDLSFSLKKGKILGLLGRTGSGKTTISRLLFRLYNTNMGIIRLGDVDISRVDLAELRNRIGLVTQNVQLFKANVRDNLTFFNRDIRDDSIVRVIEDVGLKGWYDSLPDGLNTTLESGGGGLSAGEAQLLAFARIFLHQDPSLVILDEASSRLDPVTENLIDSAIERLLCDRTAIIIAHRLTTLNRSDNIIILEGGAIKEEGSRADLSQSPDSYYYRLLQTGLEEVLV